MAGVKGKSGGARPGAGRKPSKKAETAATDGRDPLEFLLDVMQGKVEPSDAQLKAAQAAVGYMHNKPGADGKKAERQKAAQSAGAGKFAASAPPKLAIVGQR